MSDMTQAVLSKVSTLKYCMIWFLHEVTSWISLGVIKHIKV